MRYYLNQRLWGVTAYEGTPPIDQLQLDGQPATHNYRDNVDYYLVTSPINGTKQDQWLVEKVYFDANFVEATPRQLILCTNG